MDQRRARYYGLELTAAGRECAETIAAIEPDLDFRSLPFDIYAPDYSGIEKSQGRTVIFSDFNLNQIPFVPKELFTRLREVSGEVVGVMIESFGWQIPAAERDMTRSGSSSEYATLHDYNRNLWDTLTSLAREGVISIDFVETEAVGLKPENSMSVVRWRLLK